MNKMALIIGLSIAVMLAMAACNTGIPPQEPTPENVAIAPEDAQATIAPTPDPFTQSSSAQQGASVGQIDFGIPTQPFIPTGIKPPLWMSGNEDITPSAGAADFRIQVLGFTFPNGMIAIKAAPYQAPHNPDLDEGLTPVGRVEIGEGGSNPGTYDVNLDIEGTTQCVSGELRPVESDGSNPLLVRFVRIPLVPNPERVNSSKPSWPPIIEEEVPVDSYAGITADGVCFVLKSGESYYRYCSEPGSDLSAKKNEAQYNELVVSIRTTAEIFGLQNDLEYSQTISTLEDSGHINECFESQKPGGRGGISNGETACDSDIIAAPVTKEYLMRTPGSADLPPFQSLINNPTPEQNPCEPPPPTPEPQEKTCKSPYIVRYNEWVWKIARRCNISPYAIIDANGLLPPYWLYPGDVLILPRNAPPFPGRPQSNLGNSPFAFAWGSLPLSNALASFAWQDQSTTTPISVTVGVVKVLREIDTDPQNRYSDNKDIVKPGDYRLDYWFDGNQNFFAATISGFKYVDEVITQVTNQQIPAVPAAFINADGTEPVSAQISACRIFRRCVFFQRRCP
ncbi:MAG: LysM domain [Chloroflexi bacterium]|nr:LysM domain [Chloroflexota bacterium]